MSTSRTKALVATTATLAGLATATAVAYSWPATATMPSAAARPARVIHLVGTGEHDTNVDVGDRGFGAGDMQVSSARLKRAGRTAGRFSGSCQVTRLQKSVDELCTQVFRLHRGSIVTTGVVTASHSGPAPFDWAITGGTGRFSTARGYVHVTPGNRRVEMDVHLQG